MTQYLLFDAKKVNDANLIFKNLSIFHFLKGGGNLKMDSEVNLLYEIAISCHLLIESTFLYGNQDKSDRKMNSN